MRRVSGLASDLGHQPWDRGRRIGLEPERSGGRPSALVQPLAALALLDEAIARLASTRRMELDDAPGVSHAQGAQNFYSEGCSHRPRSGGHPMDEFVQDYETFDLGDVVLQGGATLRDAKLAYKTYGQLNGDKSNAIVYPTWYSGRHWDNEWLIGEGMALDPANYFIIVPNMLGNGLSSSPSNTPPPYDKARFPNVTFWDQVQQQHRLVTEKFGIETLPLVTGWSMGAGQTYQWAVSFPDMVQRACPFCGSSKTSEHNIVFLEGVKAALTADDAFRAGWYEERPTKGLRAAARVYAGWGFSQAFYWDQVYTEMGYSDLEDFLVAFWEGFFLDRRDPNNLLTMLWTWQNGDIGKTPGFDGDHVKALNSIKAKTIALPAEKDLYFPPEDEEYAVKHMPNAELRVIPGVWGHFAGGGVNPVDTKFIDDVLKELLAS
jgi:homoserine O-acetyltransferase